MSATSELSGHLSSSSGTHSGTARPIGATLGELVVWLKDLRRDVLLQDGQEAFPVIVIGDATPIVDVADDKEQGIPRNGSIQLL